MTLRTQKGSITQWIFKSQICSCFDKADSAELASDSNGASETALPANDLIAGAPYEFVAVIGHGGLGTVYKARNKKLNRFVAIKVLTSGIDSDERALQNFAREAKSASKLQHPNVVAVQDFGEMQDGRQYLVTEWIDGVTLEQYLKRQTKLTLAVAIEIFFQVLDGLSHAHKRGVVHRDIKPGNIMLAHAQYGGWIVKIIDFGTAKEIGTEGATTRAEDMAVSPFYMSPEQSAGGVIDQRSDLYALGCTLFEALTGVPPFRGAPLAVVMRHQTEAPPTLENASGGVEFPEYIESIVAKLLAKDQRDCYQSADEVKEALEAKQGTAKVVSSKFRKREALVVVCVVLILGCVCGFLLWQTGKKIEKEPPIAVKRQPSPRNMALDSVLGDEEERVAWTDAASNHHGLPLKSSLSSLPASDVRTLTIMGEYDITGLHKFTRMVTFSIEGATLNDAALKEIAALPSLRSLSIKECYVPRSIVTTLVPLAGQLRGLDLAGLDLRAPQLAALEHFQRLERLSLTANDLSQPGSVAGIVKLPRLFWLRANSCAVKDEALRVLSEAKNLQEISMSQAEITNDGCKYLKKLKKLTQLHIHSCPQLNDDGLRDLAQIPNLSSLNVSHTQASDTGLKYLSVYSSPKKALHEARP